MTETLFTQIQAEFDAATMFKSAVALLKKGFVRHDAIVAEVMTEVTEDYFPGVRMIVEEV